VSTSTAVIAAATHIQSNFAANPIQIQVEILDVFTHSASVLKTFSPTLPQTLLNSFDVFLYFRNSVIPLGITPFSKKQK
jgi:hypothetical protein